MWNSLRFALEVDITALKCTAIVQGMIGVPWELWSRQAAPGLERASWCKQTLHGSRPHHFLCCCWSCLGWCMWLGQIIKHLWAYFQVYCHTSPHRRSWLLILCVFPWCRHLWAGGLSSGGDETERQEVPSLNGWPRPPNSRLPFTTLRMLNDLEHHRTTFRSSDAMVLLENPKFFPEIVSEKPWASFKESKGK